MSEFRVDLDEIAFNLRHVADLDGLAMLDGFEHAEPDMVDQLLAEAARFAEEVIAPLNRVGDTEGSRRLDDGSVVTPTGFREAYRSYVDAGWGRGVDGPRLRRRRLPPSRRAGHRGDVHRRLHVMVAVPAAHPGRHQPAGRPRNRRAEGPLPAADGHRRLDWHHEPHGASGRIRPRSGNRPRPAAARRLLPAARHQDLHHLRRARPRRQHRAPGAGPHSRRTGGHQGDQLLPSAQAPARRRRIGRRPQRRALRVDRAQAGNSRQPPPV